MGVSLGVVFKFRGYIPARAHVNCLSSSKMNSCKFAAEFLSLLLPLTRAATESECLYITLCICSYSIGFSAVEKVVQKPKSVLVQQSN